MTCVCSTTSTCAHHAAGGWVAIGLRYAVVGAAWLAARRVLTRRFA